MKKAYVIAGHGTTFLSSKPTQNGMPKFFEPSTFDSVWVTDDKFEAEEKWHSFKHKFSWWHEMGVGVIELDNSDGIYDSAIAVCKQVSKS